MALRKLELALLCFMALTQFVHVSHAQNSHQDYLDAHNAARAQVGVGPLTWSDDVEAYAKDYASQRSGDCRLMHSSGQRYGENIAVGTSLTGRQAVDLWVSEKADYDYNSNSCNGDQCGHYTQVVWKNSVSLGCAQVQCQDGNAFVTCNYDPPGNFIGQRPY